MTVNFDFFSWIDGEPLSWAPLLTLVCFLRVHPWSRFNRDTALGNLVNTLEGSAVVAGILLPYLAQSGLFWLALTVLHFVGIHGSYLTADNHRYLEGYWCLSIAVAILVGNEQGSTTLSLAAAGLIGLCFLLAFIAKIKNPRYRDGSFFVHELLFEPRLLKPALAFGLATPELMSQHQSSQAKIFESRSGAESAPVPKNLRKFALILTWWTVGIEILVAVLYLVPLNGWREWGLASLLLFAVSTFMFVPVSAFGTILLLIALVTTNSGRWRVAILMIAVLLPVLSALTSIVIAFITHFKQGWKLSETRIDVVLSENPVTPRKSGIGVKV